MVRRESVGQRRADTQSRETAVALSDSMSSSRSHSTEQAHNAASLVAMSGRIESELGPSAPRMAAFPSTYITYLPRTARTAINIEPLWS